ncbi:hypothetical protein H6P81_001489 [Aristolochia fimbriata]|uniref:Bromo domain-containing protein n=1 Tax=Aristolochia fimbriata TaxID=158543 RepID=A0AAV7F887_ARIFI|nr:hypothetical protein H6P81_001489 [Aristolochia fimbriata]
MKRRRGSKAGDKKGKKKKLTVVANHPASNFTSSNAEDDLGSDYVDDDQQHTSLEADMPSHGPDKVNNDTDCQGYRDRNVLQSGHGRVKVKLKSSKALESQRTCSDTQTQSDTDKSSQQVASERHGEIVEKKDIRSNLQSEPVVFSGSSLRKVSTVKIRASGGLASQVHDDRGNLPFDNENTPDSHVKELKLPQLNYRFNEKELNTALGVIKKIMKMDAAEPFNVPVNPVALGIPDYFDIIETPMDFGTICHNIEHGSKYRNSEDIFKDVQIIWENCHRYNNKGDYILDLMKRVKKNFNKHWMAAGLHSDSTKRSNDVSSDHDSGTLDTMHLDDDRRRGNALVEPFGRKTNTMKSELEIGGSPSLDGRSNGASSIQMKGAVPSSQEKKIPKGVLKQKKKGRHGIDLHKSDCLCAVCVVRRRKRERFAQMAQTQVSEQGDAKPSPEFKQEEKSTSSSQYSASVSRNSETPVCYDLETDTEDHRHEFKLETPDQDSSLQEKQEMSENEGETQKEDWEEKPSGHFLIKGSNAQNVSQGSQDLDIKDEIPACNDAAICDHEEGAQKLEESSKKCNDTQLINRLLHYENPEIMHLCGMLFPSNPRSGWSGPHSLINHDMPSNDTPINSAIAMFMK